MKRIIALTALVAVFFYAPAAAQEYRFLIPGPTGFIIQLGKWILRDREEVFEIATKGRGTTMQEARDQALRLAVSEAVGSLLLSQVRVSDGWVREHEIINYASGYVHNSRETCNRREPDGLYTVCLLVQVRRSALVDGLFNSTTVPGEVSGKQAADTIRSLDQERRDGNRVLGLVTQTYPRAAFDLAVTKTSFRITRDGIPEMLIRYDLAWNSAWVNSMREALRVTNQLDPSHECFTATTVCARVYSYVTLQLRSGTWGMRERAVYRDSSRFALVRQHISGTELRLRVNLLDDQGRVRHQSCHELRNWNTIESDDWRVVMFAFARTTDTLVIPGFSAEAIESMRNVKLEIVGLNRC